MEKLSYEEHLDDLLSHLEKIRINTEILGRRLIAQGRPEFGRNLIARGLRHDNSKFYGIEWDYLHSGNKIPKKVLSLAIANHQKTNPHHPEYWGGLENMPEIACYEMACDLFARSQEFGTGIREWIETSGEKRYHISSCPKQRQWLKKAVDVLLKSSFVK